AIALAYSGDCAGALQYANMSIEVDRSNPVNLGEMASVHARCGRIAQARAAVAELERQRSNDRVLFPLAMAYAALGNSDAALTALENAVDRRVVALTAYSVALDPLFDGIRGDPRFKAVLRGMGLPETALNPR
ncbi:MAG: tetratricopeptide repeat protein, partial [Gemmatimonadaceae bacterium]